MASAPPVQKTRRRRERLQRGRRGAAIRRPCEQRSRKPGENGGRGSHEILQQTMDKAWVRPLGVVVSGKAMERLDYSHQRQIEADGVARATGGDGVPVLGELLVFAGRRAWVINHRSPPALLGTRAARAAASRPGTGWRGWRRFDVRVAGADLAGGQARQAKLEGLAADQEPSRPTTCQSCASPWRAPPHPGRVGAHLCNGMRGRAVRRLSTTTLCAISDQRNVPPSER